MSVRLTVVTCNIGRTYKPGEAKESFRRVRHGFPDAEVGWQEIDEADPDDEHHDLGGQFGPDHYRNIGFQHAVPISVPTDWDIIPGTAQVTLACQWLAGATPNRYIVEVLARHRGLPDPVRFANGHYPLARLGGRTGQQRWNDCQAAWEARALEWRRSNVTTITTRDTNRLHNMPPLHPTERQLLPNAISRITVIEGSVGVARNGPPRMVDLTIDGHNAWGVDLLLYPKVKG